MSPASLVEAVPVPLLEKLVSQLYDETRGTVCLIALTSNIDIADSALMPYIYGLIFPWTSLTSEG